MLLLQEVLFFITENQNNKKAEFDKKIIQSNLKFYGVKTSLL